MLFERADEAAQHRDRRRLARLLDLDDLKAAGQRGVLLEIFLVFGPGRRRDRAQLAARQRRLQQVGGVVLARRRAGADDGVRLVDEEDDRPRARLDLLDDRFEPVLEFAAAPPRPPATGRDRACARRRRAAPAARRPAAMRSAKPSTTAVLPTPASPVRIGLFCRRRVRMSMTWRISLSRPRIGSILPARAAAVRSIVNCASAPEPAGAAAPFPAGVAATPSVAVTALAASLLDAVTAAKSRFSASAGMRSSWPETSRARRASVSSASNAHNRWPERRRDWPCSTEASSHACLASSTISGDRLGARALPVFIRSSARLRSIAKPALVDLVLAQDRRNVAVGRIEQLHQPVLDLDVVMGARQGQPRGGFERPPARLVQSTDQRLQVYCRHRITSRPKVLRHQSARYAAARYLVQPRFAACWLENVKMRQLNVAAPTAGAPRAAK